jgi:trehalose 6-phosphate phosphatase
VCAEVEAWTAQQADRTGLVSRAARQSVELHPPIEADKGTVLERLADGFRNVCFLGDDVGDLPAFAALDRLRRVGVVTLAVAVRSAETAPELLDAADVAVDGPAGALALLRRLSG